MAFDNTKSNHKWIKSMTWDNKRRDGTVGKLLSLEDNQLQGGNDKSASHQAVVLFLTYYSWRRLHGLFHQTRN